MGHKNDAAILIRKAAQFAAGFGTTKGDPTGVATAGTAQQFGKPTLGQQVRGGFSAISPAFQEFEESRAGLERSSAETNLALGKARQLRSQEEQLNKPFDIRNLIGNADPGGGLGQAVERELARVGADIDGNGVTTQVEFNKALNSGKVDFANINKAFDSAIVSSDKDVIAKRGAFKSKLDSINKKQIEAGQPPFRESDFKDPSFRSTFSSEAVEFDKITSAEQRNALLKERQKMVSGFAQQQASKEVLVPVAQQKLQVLQDPKFQTDLQEALDLEEKIRRGEKITDPETGQEIDVNLEDIINFLEAKYPIIGTDIRGFLRTPKGVAEKTSKRAAQRDLAERAAEGIAGRQ